MASLVSSRSSLSRSPRSRLHLSIWARVVNQPVLEDGVPYAHDVVEKDSGLTMKSHHVHIVAYGGEKHLEMIGKDANAGGCSRLC